MRKIVAGILAAALLTTVGTAGAFAAGPNFNNGQRFVDVNGDGVCDNYGTTCNAQGYVDADGDGVCDNQGNPTFLRKGMGKGRDW